ncbi:SCO family protein, partial [Natrinema hispanicum]
MDRRLYLQSIAASSIAATAGCLDSLSNTLENGNTNQSDEQQHADNTVLKPPETDLSESSHPSYGDELPSLSLPDPLIDETISTDQFEGERAVLMTFIYTNCPDGMCPALTLRLRRTQEVAAENGFSDDVALLEMTFDPERDTESKLRTFADEQGVDAEADNWHFLRPETYDRAKTI